MLDLDLFESVPFCEFSNRQTSETQMTVEKISSNIIKPPPFFFFLFNTHSKTFHITIM